MPALACLALAFACRPAVLARSHTPRLDLWMFVAVGTAVIQLIPLPRPLLRLIAPASEVVARARLLVDAGGALPLSIDPSRSARAVLLMAGVFLLFVTARAIFDAGGVRTVTRLIAVTGLALSGVALAQDATAHGLMYWTWRPIDEGPAPFGPFVNRNHFATWALMAVPLSVGYLTAHAAAHHGPAPLADWRQKVVAGVDARASMLLASATLLIVAMAASLSRSGLLGLVGALTCGGLLAFTRQSHAPVHSRARAFVLTLALVAVAAVLTQVGPAAITARFGASRVAVADRLMIWHDTLPVLRDFWLTGTGVGTFLTSMGVYQRSSPGIMFNQAHNHYLQLAAEGGVLVGLPVVLAILAFVRAAWHSLRDDHSGMYWVRAGAVSGLCGVAVQSLWETGLTNPANAAMAAVLAAIALHATVRHAPATR